MRGRLCGWQPGCPPRLRWLTAPQCARPWAGYAAPYRGANPPPSCFLLCRSTCCCTPGARRWQAAWPPRTRPWTRWARPAPLCASLRRRSEAGQLRLAGCRDRVSACTGGIAVPRAATQLAPLSLCPQAASPEDKPAARDILELRASLLAQARLGPAPGAAGLWCGAQNGMASGAPNPCGGRADRCVSQLAEGLSPASQLLHPCSSAGRTGIGSSGGASLLPSRPHTRCSDRRWRQPARTASCSVAGSWPLSCAPAAASVCAQSCNAILLGEGGSIGRHEPLPAPPH